MGSSLGLGLVEALLMAGMGIGVVALAAVGAALVKLAFWGPASPGRRDES